MQINKTNNCFGRNLFASLSFCQIDNHTVSYSAIRGEDNLNYFLCDSPALAN